jgi:hypothetical protein
MYLSTPDPYFRDIDAAAGTVENRAELELFGVPLEVRIEASCVPVDGALTGGDCRRLAVAFQRVALTLVREGSYLYLPCLVLAFLVVLCDYTVTTKFPYF